MVTLLTTLQKTWHNLQVIWPWMHRRLPPSPIDALRHGPIAKTLLGWTSDQLIAFCRTVPLTIHRHGNRDQLLKKLWFLWIKKAAKKLKPMILSKNCQKVAIRQCHDFVEKSSNPQCDVEITTQFCEKINKKLCFVQKKQSFVRFSTGMKNPVVALA